MEKIRLQKFLAHCGVASRRKSELLILEGKVKVNGQKIIELGTTITKNDVIEVNGKKIEFEKKIYVMINKPTEVVTTVYDPQGRRTVIDLLPKLKERVYPIGRLDYNTSGLLLLTNDGEVANSLIHPRHEIEKVYHATVSGVPDEEKLKNFREGIVIDGRKTAPAKISIYKKIGFKTILKISIHEGRNRQIRKMCDAIGHSVIKLERIAIGPFQLGNLKTGDHRFLKDEEVKLLKTLC